MPNITVTVSLSHEILVIYITYYVMGTIRHNSESITKSTVSLISVKLLKQWQKLSEVRLNCYFSLFCFSMKVTLFRLLCGLLEWLINAPSRCSYFCHQLFSNLNA